MTSRCGAARASRPRAEARTASTGSAPSPSPACCGTAAGTGAGGQDRRGQQQPEQHVEPEDRPPVGDGEHGRAQQRPEHAAELLHRADDAERGAAPLGRPEVGDQGERRGHETAPADALQDPARTPAPSSTAVAVRSEPTANSGRQPTSTGPGRAGRPAGRSAAASRCSRGGSRRRSAWPAAARRAEADPGQHVGQGQHDDVGVGRAEPTATDAVASSALGLADLNRVAVAVEGEGVGRGGAAEEGPGQRHGAQLVAPGRSGRRSRWKVASGSPIARRPARARPGSEPLTVCRTLEPLRVPVPELQDPWCWSAAGLEPALCSEEAGGVGRVVRRQVGAHGTGC